MLVTGVLQETALRLTLIPVELASTRTEDQRAAAAADTVLRGTMAILVLGAMEAKVQN
jgi:hypothetical protein